MLSTQRLIKISLVVVLLSIFIAVGLYFNTTLFFESCNYEPIKLHFTESGASEVPVGITIDNEYQSSVAVGQKYPVASVEIWIENPFENSWSEFKIRCENFTQQYNFWEPTGEGSEEVYNKVKAREYERTHIPEFILSSQFIKNGYVPIWLEVWYSQPSISVITDNFFKRVSHDKWEAKYTVDDSFIGGKIGDVTLFPVSHLQKVVLKVSIPSRHTIENPNEDLLIQGSTDAGYTLTKELGLGESMNLTIGSSEKTKEKDIANVLLTAFGLLVGLIGIIWKWK